MDNSSELAYFDGLENDNTGTPAWEEVELVVSVRA